jgi:toxin HigB-1
VIKSFRSRAARLVFHGEYASNLPGDIQQRAKQRLAVLHAATSLADLAAVPGNRLERLQGDLLGWWSIRINRQWRVVFRWAGPDALEVDVVDYH